MRKEKSRVQSIAKRIFAGITVMMLSLVMVLPAKAAEGEPDYSAVFDAAYYAEHYKDLQDAFGNDEAALFNHFIACGMAEGRQGNAEFNVQAYRDRYPDLQAAYGDDLVSYYMHYMICGKAEGRNGAAASAAKPGNPGNGAPVLHFYTYWDHYEASQSTSAVRNGWDPGMGMEIYSYVNMERERAGYHSYAWNSDLVINAQIRARELVTNYSHESVSDRNKNCAESISCYCVDSLDALYQTTGRMPGWMKTSVDRMYIFNPGYTDMGAGVYVDENGVAYYVVLYR